MLSKNNACLASKQSQFVSFPSYSAKRTYRSLQLRSQALCNYGCSRSLEVVSCHRRADSDSPKSLGELIHLGEFPLQPFCRRFLDLLTSGFDSSQNTSIVWCSCPTADKMLKSDVTLRSKIQFGVCPSPYTTDNSFAIAMQESEECNLIERGSFRLSIQFAES